VQGTNKPRMRERTLRSRPRLAMTPVAATGRSGDGETVGVAATQRGVQVEVGALAAEHGEEVRESYDVGVPGSEPFGVLGGSIGPADEFAVVDEASDVGAVGRVRRARCRTGSG
jgi:hypothetical protein